jgi:hypothetical protein
MVDVLLLGLDFGGGNSNPKRRACQAPRAHEAYAHPMAGIIGAASPLRALVSKVNTNDKQTGGSMKASLRHAILGLFLAAFAAAATNIAAQTTDPGMGTWKLNAEKSKFSPGPAPKSIVTRFEPSGKSVKWTAERVAADGKSTKSEFLGNYDGKEYAVKGSPTADAVVLRRIDAMTTERVNKKDGKVVSTERRVIAKDGKSYTTTVKGTTAKGEPIDIVMVFDKQ